MRDKRMKENEEFDEEEIFDEVIDELDLDD